LVESEDQPAERNERLSLPTWHATESSYGVNVETQRQIFAIGHDAGASNQVRTARCADGSSCEITPALLTTISSFTLPVLGISGAAGEIILTNDGVQFGYSLSSGGTWTTSALAGAPTIQGAHYSPGLGYFAAAAGSTYRGSTIANLIANGGVPTNAPAGQGCENGKCEFADNGSTIIMCGTTVAALTPFVVRSTNGGASWTLVLTGTVGSDEHWNVCWSDYYQLFFHYTSGGSLASSPDGLTWTNIRTGLTPANGIVLGRNTLLAVGPALVKPTTYTAIGTMSGICYSLDQGVTWRYHYFLEGAFSTWPIASLNGRVYAIGTDGTDRFVFRSGLLGAALTEI
jgi:hypothetical protein